MCSKPYLTTKIKWIQYFGVLNREVSRFMKLPFQTLGTPIVSTILYMLIFGVSLGSFISIRAEDSYLTFLTPGLIAMILVKNAFDNNSSSIVAGKYVNELQDYRTTPLTTNQLLWAFSMASFIRGAIVGVITYCVGNFFLFMLDTPLIIPEHPFHLIAFVVIGGLSFAQLGTFVSMISKSFEHIGIISSFILTPLIYLGGVFFPLTKLHPFWQTVSKFNPLLYLINGLRYSLIGYSDVSISLSLVVTILFFILTYFLSLSVLKQGKNYYK